MAVDIRQCQKGDIIAYKRYGDFPGGTLTSTVRFGIFQEVSIRTMEGYDAREWVIIIMENGENGGIIPSQIINVFKDATG